ncbi:protoporphyrinogen/coproporphyrinogen oxidase [Ruania halotolerans]|uniref:protoporphyrinogen/coproporphyrinogen oxidase n=1 Tax=Ruania halotolerans TaxID=2897773 RepID=UPI001E2C1B51|nr:FAD-dependent oxidoreductase [Ruania halotolerans]UFU07780.1 FAD-dependent oxidoreductase [Ruania halotolerans]
MTAGPVSHDADVVVIGGGVAGLVAARAAAIEGAAVVLIEASATFGGLVGSHQLAGLTLDSGAESFATRGGTVAALAAELNLPLATPAPVPARVLHHGVLHSLPAAGVLGIPTDLGAPGLADVLGADGLARARQDLTLGAPTSGDAAPISLADLVRSRMGDAVLDALVRPIVRGVHSVEPENLSAEVLLPGIHERLTTYGSLAAALASIRAAAPAGSAVAGIDGGMHRLVSALTEDLRARGVTLLTAAPAQALHRIDRPGTAGQWQILYGHRPSRACSASESAASNSSNDGNSSSDGNDGGAISARSVILATAPPTWDFLAPDGPTATDDDGATESLAALREIAASWPRAQEVDLLTLVVRTADLPAHTQAGTLVAEPGHGAKALTYASAKWDWVARAVNGGSVHLNAASEDGTQDEARAVVRLSYGPGIVPAGDAAAQRALALRDAGVLTGTPPWPEHALDALAHTRLHPPAPVLSWATSHAAGPLREAVGRLEALSVTGAWICGSGLASVVPDATAAGREAAAGD